jgi:predicted nucleic acid-binding protein
MIVLDANILIRAILGQRVGQLLDHYSQQGVRFYAPETAYAEAEEYLPTLLRKKGKPDTDLAAAVRYLKSKVEPVERESYGIFEAEARARLAGRDDDDWPVLAAALALACPIWTEDQDFFGTGAPVWTTGRVEIFLKAQVEHPAAHEE